MTHKEAVREILTGQWLAPNQVQTILKVKYNVHISESNVGRRIREHSDRLKRPYRGHYEYRIEAAQ
jgi:hypothetical protein